MASGDVMLDASGNVILDALGNVLLDDGAGNGCCCAPPPPCAADCPDGGPAAYTVTLTGVSVMSGCFACTGGATGYLYCDATINGTFTLDTYEDTQSFCGWSTTFPLDVRRHFSPATDCSGTPSLAYTFGRVVLERLRGSSDNFNLRVEVSIGWLFFRDTQASVNCRSGLPTFTNDQVGAPACSGGLNGPRLGSGGTATVSPA
jgi:hypothetical protein